MLRVFTALSAALLAVLLGASPAVAQSQAANGAIEGTVGDSSGGVLPGVSVTITNVDNGSGRTVVTNEDGLYRALLLPLGTYRVVTELQGFKKVEQTGIRVAVGATVVVNATLEVGAVNETVTVSAESLPAVELSRIDIGHTMSDLEVHSLPLVARNPYNFALQQPGVTGYENVEFGVPRLAANGQAMRINYLIDGNTNTEKDRAGLRLLPMSEVMIEQVKVVTTGFAPEFGQAMGMIYNAVTPSGTNAFRGQGSYLFRRNGFSAFPFFFGCGNTTPAANCPAVAANAVRPATKVDTGTASVGGPLIRNRMFFYGGWEQTRRDLSANSLITPTAAVLAQLGLPAQPAAAPNVQTAKFAIGKVDYQLNGANRLTARWIRFANDSPYNAGTGGGAILSRQTDFVDGMQSSAAQLITSLGSNRLNELRVQYAFRHQQSSLNADSGTGPAINIASPAVGFGGPYGAQPPGQNNAGFDFKQKIWQVVDNFTYVRGSHSYKFGFDYQHVFDERISSRQFLYTFPTIAAYLDAKNGVNPFSYTNVVQLTGDPGFEMSSNLFSAFVQDDWQIAPRIKLLYGLRYDLYKYPAGLANAPLAQTRSFSSDGNNLGPRVGVAWALDSQSVVRASTGLMFDQPILGGYEQALQLSGSPKAPVYNFSGATPGAPAFPNPVPTGTLALQSPWAVNPDFRVAHTWQTNAQYERSFARDLAAGIGFMYARGWNLPVVNDINLTNPVGALADGRPIYNATANATTRVDPRFNHVYEVQAIGESTFKSLTLQVNKRFQRGLTFNAQYSFGKAVDNAPLVTQLTVQAEGGRSDPTNLDRDKGPNALDLRHNFAGSLVFQSSSGASNAIVRQLLAGNEIGVLFAFNSGLPMNIISNRDLNGDGFANNDRPLGVSRNSLYMPVRKNVDLRYTRWVPIHDEVRAEIIAELKNVFNIRQLQFVNAQPGTVNTVVATDTLGTPTVSIPTDPYLFVNPSSASFEQRKFQLGFRVRF